MRIEECLETCRAQLDAFEDGDPSPAIDGAGDTLRDLIAALQLIEEDPGLAARYDAYLAERYGGG